MSVQWNDDPAPSPEPFRVWRLRVAELPLPEPHVVWRAPGKPWIAGTERAGLLCGRCSRLVVRGLSIVRARARQVRLPTFVLCDCGAYSAIPDAVNPKRPANGRPARVDEV